MGIIVAAIIGLFPITIEAIIAKSLLFIPFIPVVFLGALVLYVPYHFYRGARKKKQFIAAGGDPTGITLWMFGSMGGQLLKDGTWRWKIILADSRRDYYNSETTTPLKESLLIQEPKR